MARRLKEGSKKDTSLITEGNANNNPKLAEAIAAANRNFKLGRRNMRIDHTAMTPNPRPIYKYRSEDSDAYRMLYGAGWYLSPEDVAIRDAVLKDERNGELNKAIWQAMENEGLVVDKTGAQYKNVEVVDVEDEN